MTDPNRFLEVTGLVRRFSPGEAAAVGDVSFAAPRGRVLALLGPSGSGKTTTLRLLAGFERPDAGSIRIDGDEIATVPPEKRHVGMVFQHYALFPHLDVAGNVAFGLETAGHARGEIRRRVDEALALVDLGGLGRRRVDELSGGQQQRVALARALAPEPRVLLLDEPLSNLDPALRERTRAELAALVRRVGITTVLVTHEQEEAFELADAVVLLRHGRVEQAGPPEELYDRPASRFVAGFVGRASEIAGEIRRRDGGATPRIEFPRAGGVGWALPAGAAPSNAFPEGTAVVLAARPEALRFADAGEAEALPGRVARRRFAGARTLWTVQVAEGLILEVEGGPRDTSVDETVHVAPRPDARGLHLFAADEGTGS